jgi:hypothetical protein
MADEEKDWQLDTLLDSLLRSYSAADPRPGFETRLRAVVGAQITRVRRTNWLMLAASAAAVVLFAWIMIAKTHTAKVALPSPVAVAKPAPNPVKLEGTTVPHVTRPAARPPAEDRYAKARARSRSQLVLQMVESTEGSGSLLFEHEKLYLTAEKPLEAETAAAPVPEQETQAPAVTIKAIGVASIESNAPIEIKDLAPPKSSSEKGSL